MINIISYIQLLAQVPPSLPSALLLPHPIPPSGAPSIKKDQRVRNTQDMEKFLRESQGLCALLKPIDPMRPVSIAHIKETDYAFEILLANALLESWEKSRELRRYLADFVFTTEQKGDTVVLTVGKIARSQLTDISYIDYVQLIEAENTANRLCFGISGLGPLSKDLTSFGNTLVWGLTGMGKTNFVLNLLAQIRSYHPDTITHVIDLTGNHYRPYFPDLSRGLLASDHSQSFSLQDLVLLELEARRHMFAQTSPPALSIAEFQEHTGIELPRHMLIIDDYRSLSALHQSPVSTGEGDLSRIDYILKYGFAYGIQVLCVTQREYVDLYQAGRHQAYFHQHVAFASYLQSQFIDQIEGESSKIRDLQSPIPGHAIDLDRSRPGLPTRILPFQSFYCDDRVRHLTMAMQAAETIWPNSGFVRLTLPKEEAEKRRIGPRILLNEGLKQILLHPLEGTRNSSFLARFGEHRLISGFHNLVEAPNTAEEEERTRKHLDALFKRARESS